MEKLLGFVIWLSWAGFTSANIPENCTFPRFRPQGFLCFTESELTAENRKPYLVNIINQKDTTAQNAAQCLIGKVECDVNSPFRSHSGYCNNLKNPDQGAAFSLFNRMTSSNAYSDGKEKPREYGVDGRKLRGGRKISTTVNSPAWKSDRTHSFMTSAFAQFVMHDITGAPAAPGNKECRECDTNDIDCMPLTHMFVDAKLNWQTGCAGCTEFTRSANGIQDNTAPRNQINEVSGYLDLSQVYGSDYTTAQNLRDLTNQMGKLKSQQNDTFLPQVENGTPCYPLSNESCFFTGDERNGETTAIMALHTLFMKEHNRIAQFFYEKTEWTGDQIYQKTKQILTAMYQHVVYSEFLPILVPEAIMNQHGIQDEGGNTFFTGYDENVDASALIEFASVFTSFVDTTFSGGLYYQDAESNSISLGVTHNWFNVERFKQDPFIPMGSVMWLTLSEMGARDRHFHDSRHHYWYGIYKDKKRIMPSSDKNAINIQRGRDHGIHPYNVYRKHLGLSELSTFEELVSEGIVDEGLEPNLISDLKAVYDNVADIDLVTAVTFENMRPDGTKFGILGDVASHIVAEQFERLKKGDRFFYSADSSTNPGHFTAAQLEELRKVTFATIICEHMVFPHNKQRFTYENIFLRYGYGTQVRAHCDNVMKLMLNKFLSPNDLPEDTTDVVISLKPETVVASAQHCQGLCDQESECDAFEFHHDNGMCYLWKGVNDLNSLGSNDKPRTIGLATSKSQPIVPLIETFASNWTIHTVDPRCGLEKVGAFDIGVKFM